MQGEDDNICVICQDAITNKGSLDGCTHEFWCVARWRPASPTG